MSRTRRQKPTPYNTGVSTVSYVKEYRDAQLGIVRNVDTECIAKSKCMAVNPATCVHTCAMRAMLYYAA